MDAPVSRYRLTVLGTPFGRYLDEEAVAAQAAKVAARAEAKAAA